SRLGAALEYLVPPAADLPPMPCRPVREIALLDPACGAMHFGLAAFDLFHAMYCEEQARAGEPGWPARPSIADPAAVPGVIVTETPPGRARDAGVLPPATLGLLLKAKPVHRDAPFPHPTLVCGTAGAPGTPPRPFDVVPTNPPYLGNRHLPADVVE